MTGDSHTGKLQNVVYENMKKKVLSVAVVIDASSRVKISDY